VYLFLREPKGQMDIEKLIQKIEGYNRAYRSGTPQISDAHYDQLVEQLRALDPHHPYLHTVEPERFSERQEIRHPDPMLSTEKAYSVEQLERFVTRVAKAASEVGRPDPQFRLTPKLDGLAGRDDGRVFVSRGNGLVGYEISSAFEKGVIPVGGRGQGLGEIVVVQSYFDAHCAGKFEHPRNMVVGIVASDRLNQDARQALENGMVHFVPYNQLLHWQGAGDELIRDLYGIGDRLMAQTDYPLDGTVVEAVSRQIKSHMGATAHHYRWQIAVKRKGETKTTHVESLAWQVGRTGNVTPVLLVTPVTLSGATIRRVSAHNAGIVQRRKIGPGAQIEVIRSGEVIPKLEQVLVPARQVELPHSCPACGEPLSWRGDFLRCTNIGCPAKIEQSISHWFRTLGSADWFGIKTIQKLVNAGYTSLEKIYALGAEDFAAIGFGPVQSKNLAGALATSRTKQVEDWRFLAAFGIADLGVGDSRRLLQHIELAAVMDAKAEQIEKINGFGDTTSRSIVQGLERVKRTFQHMLDLGFNLERTPLRLESPEVSSLIAGKRIVFTGKMSRVSRQKIQNGARALGAVVQSAVSSTTDFLVCGENVGPKKLEKASRLGVEILTEAEYYQLTGQ
jgi:DNA ligase (NAD+)